MRILLAIVHHWNPDGGGGHASLRADPKPRLDAFEQQLLALQRIGQRQSQLNIAVKEAQPANESIRHHIHVAVITDGEHHLIDRLDPRYQGLYSLVLTKPQTPRHLGFEAQKFLASRLQDDFDIYGYLEDDLVIHDPYFFHKIDWFSQQVGDEYLLLPHRMELVHHPHPVDRFYIDGSIHEEDLRKIIPNPEPTITINLPGINLAFESPKNPHSGCFFLSKSQLASWTRHQSWQDGDTSWISPLESAATLGLTKIFKLFKPSFNHAAWLEIQHWGNSFHCLLGRKITLPGYSPINQIETHSVEDNLKNIDEIRKVD